MVHSVEMWIHAEPSSHGYTSSGDDCQRLNYFWLKYDRRIFYQSQSMLHLLPWPFTEQQRQCVIQQNKKVESVEHSKSLDGSRSAVWKVVRIPVVAVSVEDGDARALFCCSLFLYSRDMPARFSYIDDALCGGLPWLWRKHYQLL